MFYGNSGRGVKRVKIVVYAAGAYSRKSAEKVLLAEYAIRCQLAKFSSRKVGRKYVIRGLCASALAFQQSACRQYRVCFVHDSYTTVY